MAVDHPQDPSLAKHWKTKLRAKLTLWYSWGHPVKLLGNFHVKESSSVISYSIFFLSNKPLNWCGDVCLQNLKSRIFKNSPLWKPGIFVAGSSESEWHISSPEGRETAAGTAIASTALLQFGMNILATLLTLTFSLLNVNMAHEAASSLPSLQASQKHIQGDYGFNSSLTHHISFHW